MEPNESSTSPSPSEGWTRRFVAGPARLREYVEFYRSLGFEVRLEPMPGAELAEQCSDCALALMFFKVIYTRRPS